VTERRGSREWPPCSPDMTPTNFFPWNIIKGKVYAKKTTKVNHSWCTLKRHSMTLKQIFAKIHLWVNDDSRHFDKTVCKE
jgi:hypothetical protein